MIKVKMLIAAILATGLLFAAQIPPALKAEHEELHGELVRATKAGGSTGEAAKAVAKLMHPHFVRRKSTPCRPLAYSLRCRRARSKAAWPKCSNDRETRSRAAAHAR